MSYFNYFSQKKPYFWNRKTITYTHISAYRAHATLLTYNDEVGCFEGVGETVVEQYEDVVVNEVSEVGEAAEHREGAPRKEGVDGPTVAFDASQHDPTETEGPADP